MDKHTDISDIFKEKILPASIRMPKSLMNKLRNEAKDSGRTIGKQLTIILAERYDI